MRLVLIGVCLKVSTASSCIGGCREEFGIPALGEAKKPYEL